MPLQWTREQDGEHNGRPCYEYHATAEGRTFHIVFAYDAGFGYTAVRKDEQGRTEYLHRGYSVVWAKTLKRCKEQCEAINREHQTLARGDKKETV